jgi:molecular chaperone DnaK (HSP70)
MSWALDLGTTNTAIARWDEATDRPDLVELPEIARRPSGLDPLEMPRLVPSVVEIIPDPGFLARLGSSRLVSRFAFVGRLAIIGRPALERNAGLPRAAYVPGFKALLGSQSLRVVARAGRKRVTARDAARLFLRELLAEVRRASGRRPRDLAITVPADSFETYRAELRDLAHAAGAWRVRFVDEPVAAALGYGLGLSEDRPVLVVDIGGGTMHCALVRLSSRAAAQGSAVVLAKETRRLGGEVVDEWLLQEGLKRLEVDLPASVADDELLYWRRSLLSEACRVKESLHLDEKATFEIMPPEELRSIHARLKGHASLLTFTRDDLVELLRSHGWNDALRECIDLVLEGGAKQGVAERDVRDVLLVGGSTLLPGVAPSLEKRFGRDALRAWQPFEAVAYGATAFAADRVTPSDFIVHDYAIRLHDAATHQPRHVVIIGRGTRFPTADDAWRARLVPTCSLGEPETTFKLIICEVGRGEPGDRRFAWDAGGQLAKLGGAVPSGRTAELVVPLNETSPAMGTLSPPHDPGNRHPRLDVAFGVNDERWLIATVKDLLTGKTLMDREPVVRLL